MSRWNLTGWGWLGSAMWLFGASPIAAQVVPDATLPVGERSQVTGSPNVQIDGGARRGGNLFHSFSQFSIPRSGSAFFNNAADVRNIFSRVTGRSISNIDGLIRANGTANLFLLNPNGILFGPNASLNIGGSFVATTANAIGFPNGEIFSSDATKPLPSQLLTVNPNAFFFNQLTPQPIIVQARFDRSISTLSSPSGTGLHVPPGKNLLLVGGPIQFDSGEPVSPGRPLFVFFLAPGRQEVQPDGGWIISPGSYIELGAVDGVGTVGLSTASSDWQLTIPNTVPRADVSFNNGSGIYAAGDGGSIRVLAQNVDISKSQLWMGIPRYSRLSNTQTGDLELNATGSINLSLSLLNNDLAGQGTIGNINLTAGDRVSLYFVEIYNRMSETSVGHAGDININAGSVSLTRRSRVQSYTDGRNVNINARDTVSINDSSQINSAPYGTGNGGDLNITARAVSLSNDAWLTSGNGGKININAYDTVSLTQYSRLFSAADTGRNASNININAANTVSLDQSSVSSRVINSAADAGNININTRSLSLTHGSNVSSTTVSLNVNGSPLFASIPGKGNAGNVTINARDRVSIDGEGVDIFNFAGVALPVSYSTSAIYTTVNSGAVGQGGDVTITANSLSLTNGGAVNTSTRGQGNAGRVTIHARGSVEMSGTAVIRPNYRSGVFTSAQPGAVGNAGAIDITAQSLSVFNGARLSASTVGAGDTGNIITTAPEPVDILGRPLPNTNTQPSARGSGGSIRVVAKSLDVQNQAEVTVSSTSAQRAGNLFIDADRTFLNNGGSIRADTNGGGGNVNLRSPFIFLRNGSNITTNATGANIPGGNIGIATRFLIAVPTEDSNISANSEDFRGGNVRINAVSIFGIQPRPNPTPLSDITATGATSALPGTIDVTTAGIDPTSGLVELPADLVDASGVIAQGCPANQGNSFVITGRGGLPPTPEQQLDDDAEWQDRRRLTVAYQPAPASVSTSTHHPLPPADTPIIEATGWQTTSTGDIILVAATAGSARQHSAPPLAGCQGRP